MHLRRDQADNGGELLSGELGESMLSLPQLLWSALRGRLALATVLALVLSAPLAFLGFRSAKPLYESEGSLKISPSRPEILYQTQFSQQQPYFLDYVRTEAKRLEKGRVLEVATQDPAMRAIGWPEGAWGAFVLEKTIEVPFPGGYDIGVKAMHPDKEIAKTIVDSILRAYMTVQEEDLLSKKLSISGPLLDREEELKDRYAGLEAELEEMAKPFGGVDALKRRLDSADTTLNALDEQIRKAVAATEDLDGEIVRRRAVAEARARGELDVTQVQPSREELLISDAKLAELSQQRRVLQGRIEFERQNGLLDSHPIIVQAQADLGVLDRLIDDRAAALQEQFWSTFGVETERMAARRDSSARQVADLRAQRAGIAEQQTQVAEVYSQATLLMDRVEDARKRLQQATDRREQLNVELQQNPAQERLGQAEILNWGNTPVAPAKDARKVRALAGGMFGVMLAFGGVAALGMVDRRLRYIDEASAGLGVPLLGSVPEAGPAELEQLGEVAEPVHHIRARLELSTPRRAGLGVVHAVTSPMASDGKSTLATAVARSFAAAGDRTLLIDADPAGSAVTDRFGLGGSPGFGDRSPSVPAEEYAFSTPSKRLWVMPAGRVEEQGQMSYQAVEQMLTELRGRFDRVIIDTGPLMGSTEATLVCRAADSTIVVVSRGRTPKQTKQVLARLREIGARCAGVVFNRADRADFDKHGLPGPSVNSRRSVRPSGGGVGRTSLSVAASL
jgi:Mrp family chromosome partitioning ATPase/uncharacterized protein involved in exopolysaccharide biosynthesis